MSDLIRLSGTTVNAPDAIALARFYAEITGGVAKGDEYWALVEGPNGRLIPLRMGPRLTVTGPAGTGSRSCPCSPPPRAVERL